MAVPLLDGPRLSPAAGGAAHQLVAFLHGYGADGNDLIGLAREWARLLPHAAFVSPNAPEPCGVSQGTMMALAVGLARNPAPTAIVGYSGALTTVEALPKPGAGPAILLVHGDMDEVIPVDAMLMAREALARAGLPVEWHIAQGIGHGIDGEGMRLGGEFLKQSFAAAQASQGS
jgi:phospholipase/carboxylesterase